MLRILLCVLLFIVSAHSAQAEKVIYAADHNTGKVVKFKEDGTPLWDFPNRSAHDVQLLANGNILINPRSVQEVTPEKEIVWDDAQIETFRGDIDRLVSVAEETPLSAVARLAQADLKTQKGRSGGVATLMTRAIGKVVEAPGFELYRGDSYSDESLAEGVTVLHFWEYRSSPLEQPYGQVGYLDFLYRKYKEQGVQVVGVVSNPLLEDPAERSRVRVNARKFASFMNLSFPIGADVKGYI